MGNKGCCCGGDSNLKDMEPGRSVLSTDPELTKK